MANLSRRDFLKITVESVAFLLLSPPELKAEEDVIISDPEILKYYEDLLKQLIEGKLEYNYKDTFDPYFEEWKKVKKYCEEHEIDDEGTYIYNPLIPEELKANLSDLYWKHTNNEFKCDDFSDVPDISDYIKSNRLELSDVLREVETNNFILFGESHGNISHNNFVYYILKNHLKQHLVYIDESFLLHRKEFFEEYLIKDREKAIGHILQGLKYPEKVKRNLRLIKSLGISISMTEVVDDLEKRVLNSSDPPMAFARRDSVREQVMARQIHYVTEQGYKVLGSFGYLHLRDNHLPKYLKLNAVKPLIISGGDFTLDVYNTALDISNGDDIFFKRNDKIIYVTQNLWWCKDKRE